MGAINYNSCNLLNIGFNLDMFNNDYEEERQEENYYIYDLQQEYYEEAKNIINKYNNINYYDIELQAGYYDGFYINIKRRYLYLDNYTERQQMLKDVTKIKKLINEILNINYMQLYSCCGWGGCGWIDNTKEYLKTFSNNEKTIILKKYRLDSSFKSFQDLLQYTNNCTLCD